MPRAEKPLQQSYLSRAVKVTALAVQEIPAVCPIHGDTAIQAIVTAGIRLGCNCIFMCHQKADSDIDETEWRLHTGDQ